MKSDYPGNPPIIDDDVPEDFRRLVEAMHWAKCFLQAADMEDAILLSQATDWFARAMDAARQGEREELARQWSENE